jgi:hypothetical protein
MVCTCLRALANYFKEDTFTVPELFGDEWNPPNGVACQFGKNFFAFVEAEYGSEIRFISKNSIAPLLSVNITSHIKFFENRNGMMLVGVIEFVCKNN